MPRIDNAGDETLHSGKLFYYADARNTDWQVSPKGIDDADSAIARTVAQVFGAKRAKVGGCAAEREFGGEFLERFLRALQRRARRLE